MVRCAAPMGVNQDVRIECNHPLPAIHELEELISIREVDSRQEAAGNRLEAEGVGGRSATSAEGQA